MSLTILDRQVLDLAETLARKRNVTTTEAVIQALKGELEREEKKASLADRIAGIAAELAQQAGPNRRVMSKDEIDAMWGHS